MKRVVYLDENGSEHTNITVEPTDWIYWPITILALPFILLVLGGAAVFMLVTTLVGSKNVDWEYPKGWKYKDGA
jgi:hypothetical protein